VKLAHLNETLRTDCSDEQYGKAAKRIADVDVNRLLHASMGLVTESAEFLDAMKKFIYYGKELDKINLIEELGDVFFYMSMACSVLGVSIEEVSQTNIKKLKKRYPVGFTEDSAINRDVESERKVLEGEDAW
jgi:NTP pyrophosphatase (non-canonical NTP hydrolase)